MFYENFEHICKERGISPSAAVVGIGKSRTLSAAWKKNGTIPRADDVQKLAEFLDCSVNDLLVDGEGNTVNVNTSVVEVQAESNNERNPDMLEFERVYNMCSTREKHELMNLIYEFEDSIDAEREHWRGKVDLGEPGDEL